jgi:hypothetical protein
MKTRKIVFVSSLVVFLLQSVGCGVLLHPERQGQKGGRIDPAVAILDGLGLLLYIIPGLVAFAVDFHKGTIYLPGGTSDASEPSPVRAVKLEGPMTEDNIEAALQRELGREVDLSGVNVQALRIDPEQLHLMQQFARSDSNSARL